MRLKRKDKNAAIPAKTGWDVRIAPATRQRSKSYYDYEPHSISPVEGEVAVRLTYNGWDSMTIGVVEIKNDNFEDIITTLRANAQEKASALTAVGATG